MIFNIINHGFLLQKYILTKICIIGVIICYLVSANGNFLFGLQLYLFGYLPFILASAGHIYHQYIEKPSYFHFCPKVEIM